MASVMGIGHAPNPVGRRADCGDRNEGSGANPAHVGERSERRLGGGCGRCGSFHWSRLFKTVVHNSLQLFEKKWRSGLFQGRVAGMKAKEETAVVKVRQRAKPEKGTKMVLSESTKKEAMEAARYGMPIDRIAILCGFPSGNQTQWSRWINANPAFQMELDQARAQGELLLQRRIMSGEQNWQAAGWMLERTRGYVARAQLEHTGKGGKELSVSGALLGAFGGGK